MFVKKRRPITDIEKQQLRINRVLFEGKLKHKFNFIPLVFFTGSIITCLFGFYFFKLGWLLGVAAFFVFCDWLVIESFFNDKKINKNRIEDIDKLLQGNGIEIQEVKCTRAILFEDAEDLGDYHILELKDGTLLCLIDITGSYRYIMPNTHFEIYVNPSLYELFRKSINTLGTDFPSIQFSYEVTQCLLDDFLLNYEDGQIIYDFTFDNFLDKVEEMVQS